MAVEDPSKIEKDEDRATASVAVTVDGTWQKWEHTSKIGVVFVVFLSSLEKSRTIQ